MSGRSRFALGLAIVIIAVNAIAVMGTRPLGAQRDTPSTTVNRAVPTKPTTTPAPKVAGSKKATTSPSAKAAEKGEATKRAAVDPKPSSDPPPVAESTAVPAELPNDVLPPPGTNTEGLLNGADELSAKIGRAGEFPQADTKNLQPVQTAFIGDPAKDSDPEQAANDFLANARREAEAAVKSLNEEAETLRDRLKKVEAAAKRWETLLAALDPNASPPKIDPPPPTIDPPPSVKPSSPKPVASSSGVKHDAPVVPPPPPTNPARRP
jgi:hypothetical protein